MMNWAEIFRWGILWGPGIVILVGIYALVRKPPGFIGEFIGAEQAQAVAMTQMARAVERVTERDSSKLDEVLVGQQLILARIDHVQDEFTRHQRAHGHD